MVLSDPSGDYPFYRREADGGRAGRTLCPVRTWCPVIEGFVTRDCSTAEAPRDLCDDMIEALYIAVSVIRKCQPRWT